MRMFIACALLPFLFTTAEALQFLYIKDNEGADQSAQRRLGCAVAVLLSVLKAVLPVYPPNTITWKLNS